LPESQIFNRPSAAADRPAPAGRARPLVVLFPGARRRSLWSGFVRSATTSLWAVPNSVPRPCSDRCWRPHPVQMGSRNTATGRL